MLVANETPQQDLLYKEVLGQYAAAIDRLTRAYEADPEERHDLVQKIHFALWRSLSGFDRRSSLRTWAYRVAHNTATSHVIQRARTNARVVAFQDIETIADEADGEVLADQRQKLDRLLEFIQQLNPLDRQVIVLYLEDMDAAAIGEIIGISAGNVATKIHRIKTILKRRFQVNRRAS